MPGRPAIIPTVPAETARTAKAVFGGTNFYIRVGEQIGSIIGDAELEHLSRIGRCLQSAGAILPLVTFFQFIESLTDEQVIDAFRLRTDWKFALHLPVHVPVFPEDALCRFRHKIVADPASQLEFQILVDRMIKLDPPNKHATQEYEILAQISAICSINRLERVRQAMSQAIEALALEFPDQLRQIALPHWYGRYNRLAPGSISTSSARLQDLSIASIGIDILHLLGEVDQSNLPRIKKLQEIVVLRQVWKQQYENHSLGGNEGSTDLKSYDCDSCILKKGGVPGENSNHSLLRN